jgi:hypothetical protein
MNEVLLFTPTRGGVRASADATPDPACTPDPSRRQWAAAAATPGQLRARDTEPARAHSWPRLPLGRQYG